tara:strand:+ start:126 stop:338 length:213 start_codon:yes stop_codon:yes gene_type:complete
MVDMVNHRKGAQRKNQNYKTYTDPEEYLKTIAKYDKKMNEYYKKKRRGRPPSNKQQGMTVKREIFILSFD